MLNKLTQEQIDLQAKKRDEWVQIALHNKNFDKEELEAGIKWMYYASSLKEPEVVFIQGPKDFAKKLLPASVGASVWASVGASVGASVRASVWDSVRASVGASVRASVWDSVRDSVRASVRDSVRASVGASVRDSVGASVWASVWDSVYNYMNLVGDADFASWYEYWKEIAAITEQEKADKYVGFLRAGAFYTMFFEKKAFVMCRPVRIEQDSQKRLHSLIGPAIEFADGTEIYKINGVEFDKKLWKKVTSGKMKAKEVFALENLEQRRIAYEQMDKLKMKDLADYKILDEVKDDGYGNPMKLVTFTLENFDSPFYYLECSCPTTGRTYFVETRKQTCWSAKNTSFGLSDDFRFDKEF